jgi:hypothetical protein
MSTAREDTACTAPCHLASGSTSTHEAHDALSTACTTCHPVSASPADSAGSAHHTVPAPVLAGFTPGAGLPGTPVTLSGSHFTEATAVTFSGVRAVFAVDADSRITALVPSAARTGPVSVISRGGKATGAEAFVVTVVPSLTLRVAPAVQLLGRRVRLAGTLAPLSVAGLDVGLTVQQRRGGVWKTVRTIARATSATGTFSWSYAPSRRGAYRAAASLGASPATTAGRTAWVGFRIR